jgi:hypothetical protein
MSNDIEDFSDSEPHENENLGSMDQIDVEVTCPYCGEVVTISIDPSGGATQEYVEDCEVCCRPWQVFVTCDAPGPLEVKVEAAT